MLVPAVPLNAVEALPHSAIQQNRDAAAREIVHREPEML